MALRDRIVLSALGGGALVALVLWLRVSPWPAMVVVLLAVVVAAVAYRLEPPRIDLDGLPLTADKDETADAPARTSGRVDQ